MKEFKTVNFSKVKKDYDQKSNVGQAITGGLALPVAIAGGIGLGEGLKVAGKRSSSLLTKNLTGPGDALATGTKLVVGTPAAAGKATLKSAAKFLTKSPTRTAAIMATGAGLGLANSILTNKKLKGAYMVKNDTIGKSLGTYRSPLQGGKYYVTFEDARTGTAKVMAGANSRAKARDLLIENNLATSDPNVTVKIHIGKALANLYPRQFYAI